MLETTPVFEDKAASYTHGTDFWNVLTDEMHSLYLLSFLLTADLNQAQGCFLGGMGDCETEMNVFMSWAQARARRTILERAIRVVRPTPEYPDFPFAHHWQSEKSKGNIFDAVLGLNAFERFVYITTVLERQSDEECATLLGCSQRDVMIARSLALAQLANTYKPDNQPVEALGTWRTIFANHHA